MTPSRAIFFDLDGTLANSLPGIQASVAHAFQRVVPAEPVPDMERVIGPPIRTMLALALPHLAEATMDQLIVAFRAHYLSKGCLDSPLYPGVAETLAALHQRGFLLGVATNKPSAPTKKVLEAGGIAGYFAAVGSPDSREPSYSDKALMLRDLLAAQAPLELAIYVGDSPEDAEAAHACGAHFCAAAYGYGRVCERLPISDGGSIRHFTELLEWVTDFTATTSI